MAVSISEAKKNRFLRNHFIRKNQQFVLSSAEKICHRHITFQDDEWSIALIAFNEAIDSYEEGKGDFYGLAYRVMERRLYDEGRKAKRHENEVPVAGYVLDGIVDEDPDPLEKKAVQAAAESVPQHEDAEDEITEVQNILHTYGFSFKDLVSASPKAAKTKHQCAEAVGLMLRHDDLLHEMKTNHALPSKKLQKLALSEKGEKLKTGVLERCRRYIIAAVIILDGDYPILASYLTEIRKEML
jgi:RNA polymerase sigma factor